MTFIRRATHNISQKFNGQIRWQGGNIECQDRFGAHRVDIRNAVGSRDGAIGVGVIHNRREEVGCQDYRCMLV